MERVNESYNKNGRQFDPENNLPSISDGIRQVFSILFKKSGVIMRKLSLKYMFKLYSY